MSSQEEGRILTEEEEEFNFKEEEGEEEEESADLPTSDSISLEISSPSVDVDPIDYQLSEEVMICREFFIGFEFSESINRTVSFKIPTNILPLTVQVVNGFFYSSFLAECTFEFNVSDQWKTQPVLTSIINTIYGKSFPGSILIRNRLESFFKPDFKPQKQYRCQSYVLAPQTIRNPSNLSELIARLTSSGFTKK